MYSQLFTVLPYVFLIIYNASKCISDRSHRVREVYNTNFWIFINLSLYGCNITQAHKLDLLRLAQDFFLLFVISPWHVQQCFKFQCPNSQVTFISLRPLPTYAAGCQHHPHFVYFIFYSIVYRLWQPGIEATITCVTKYITPTFLA
jgi:hypothetical protein